MTPIVEMKDLRVRFKGERTVHALNGVDITLREGEVLGVLGESGSGKSVTLRALLRMLPPKRSEISGAIRVEGRDVLAPASRAVASTLAETDVAGANNAEAIIQGITRFMRPVNYLGLPALVVPAGFGQHRMPIGLQLIGRPFNDETVAALGIAFQGATDHHTKLPKLA